MSDGLLARAGFSPRRKGRGTRPLSLPAPSRLIAEARADGTVALRWSAQGNVKGTSYAIRAAPRGEPLGMIEVTTRTRVVLAGFAPGVPCAFRVVAKRAGLSSSASPVASIYGAPEGIGRRLAA